MRNPFEPSERGLSLYIHVPFCERKCNYCAFESGVPAPGERELWLELLEKELCWWGARIGRPRLTTCYIGGGTPTVLGASLWRGLCALLERLFIFTEGCEVTVEANPNSLNGEHLLIWRDWRVTRVSLGVQSFDETKLAMLGRLHSPGQAYGAVSAALASGFAVNADFMFGLPCQTLQNWGRTLREAVSCGAEHISLYQLSPEPGTPWENLDASLLPDGYAQYRWAQWYLPRKGFAQYEISNFARPGRQSGHNLNYWRGGEYLGAGRGASGYLGGWRYKNFGEPDLYAGALFSGLMPVAEGERLTDAERAREAAVLALRTVSGIIIREYVKEFGAAALSGIVEALKTMPSDLYRITGENISLTRKGMRVANRIWAELI